MKQSDPGLRRNMVLWRLGVGSELWGVRERGAFKAEAIAHTNSQSGVGASPERIVFTALSLKQLGALGRTGICSDKV